MHNQYPIESGFNYAFSKTQEIKPSDSDIDINENNKLICKIEDLKNLIDDPKSIILDTRSLDEYTGANSRGNKRIGHVPGAINIEWLEFIDNNNNNKFRSQKEIENILQKNNITPDKKITTYWQGGIRAAHVFVVLQLLGYKNISVYDASMAEYANSDKTKLDA